MKPGVKSWILPGVLSLAVVVLVAPPVLARGGSRCLAPNHTDDTTPLQTALDSCAGGPRGCTVRLCAGVFRTAPLRVGDFQGTLRGAGRGRTVVRALPDLAVNPNPDGYWRDDPLEPLLLPWPYLVQFVGGRGRVQDLTIEIPPPEEGHRPTQGWTEVDFVSQELAGAILVTGAGAERFEISRVGIVAGEDEESPLGTTLRSGVAIRGLLFDPEGDPAGFPVLPLGGRHRVSDCRLEGMLTGVSLGELAEARVTVRRSETRAFIAIDLLDASRSEIRVHDNLWEVAALGFTAYLNVDGDPSLDNAVRIYRNRGAIGSFSGFGQGIFFQDPWILPEPGESTVTVYGNELELGSEAEPAYSGIEVYGAGRLVASRNVLRGRVDAFEGLGGVGVGVDQTSGCRLLLNDLGELSTPTAPDLYLGPGTSECLAVVRRNDDVLDEGAQNHVLRLWW